MESVIRKTTYLLPHRWKRGTLESHKVAKNKNSITSTFNRRLYAGELFLPFSQYTIAFVRADRMYVLHARLPQGRTEHDTFPVNLARVERSTRSCARSVPSRPTSLRKARPRFSLCAADTRHFSSRPRASYAVWHAHQLFVPWPFVRQGQHYRSMQCHTSRWWRKYAIQIQMILYFTIWICSLRIKLEFKLESG